MTGARAIASLASALALTACASGSTADSSPTEAARELYVSLGDSYAAGYQPSPSGDGGRTTRNGFADQVVTKARARGYELELVNFGCAGATTHSMLTVAGCVRQARAVGGPSYTDRAQAAAALAFLTEHRRRVGLVTVSIGGNDVTACTVDPAPIACVTRAAEAIETNLAAFLRDVRARTGPGVRIVGVTYPNVVLGTWIGGGRRGEELARLSVAAFQNVINPTLKRTYESAGGELVDVTAASGGYRPFTETTSLRPYGVLPVAVAEVCRLTHVCRLRDIHPTTEGYALIADLVVAALPPR